LVFKLCFVSGQNIFDLAHQKTYAEHLELHKDYAQLLVVLNDIEKAYPNQLNVTMWKVKTLLNLKQNQQAFELLKQIKTDTLLNLAYQFYILKTALLLDSFYQNTQVYFDSSNEQVAELLCYQKYYTCGLNQALTYTQNQIRDSLLKESISAKLLLSSPNYPFKKPHLAATFSVIPGMGQIYAHQYSDAYLGIIPFYIHGYIAYTAFAMNGSSSLFAWLNTGIATGFYLGNIYGAYKGAKRINQFSAKKSNDEIKKHISSLDF
jgi:hypothetical protein